METLFPIAQEEHGIHGDMQAQQPQNKAILLTFEIQQTKQKPQQEGIGFILLWSMVATWGQTPVAHPQI